VLIATGDHRCTALLFRNRRGRSRDGGGFPDHLLRHYAAIQDIIAPSMRGTAMAVYFMAMYLCSASFGPLITGKISDMMARRMAAAAGPATVTEVFKAGGLQQAMLILPVMAVFLAVVLYIGSRTIGKDLQKRETASRQAAA
jgi:MFS family permease